VFICGYGTEHVSVRFVFSSIGSFSYPTYLSDKGPYDWVALHVACPHL